MAIRGIAIGDVTNYLEEVADSTVVPVYSGSNEAQVLQMGTLKEYITDGYATEEWVEEQGYLTEHQSLDGYATEEWVEGKGYLTEHQSLNGYATEEWVEGKGYLTEHQSLNGYATEEWVEGKGYLTEHQDVSGKEDSSNKVTSLSSSSTNSEYPSAKCVYDIIGNIETLLAAL